jgi:Domain of unknown function (DUF5925)/ATPase family associated with various cellular activities (AAA)
MARVRTAEAYPVGTPTVERGIVGGVTRRTVPQHVKEFESLVREYGEELVATDDAFRAIVVLATMPFTLGRLPEYKMFELGALKPTALPRRCTCIRNAETAWGSVRLLVGADWVAALRQRAEGGETTLWIAATDESVATSVRDELRAKKLGAKKTDASTVEITVVHDGRMGTSRQKRRVEAPTWPSIRRNYGGAAQRSVDALMALTPETLPAGRLLLMHGPTGTGKSTLLRSLGAAWSSWCSVDVLIDPDRFLSQPAYLNDVAFNGRPAEDTRWRLIVAEDCDEYVRPGAKAANGQNLARLLNITDGVVGHGAKLIVCLTAAEPLSKVHPSIRRHGRCIAEINVPRLTKREAKAWLGSKPMPPSDDHDGSLSLAELFASTGGPSLVPAEERFVSGTYL